MILARLSPALGPVSRRSVRHARRSRSAAPPRPWPESPADETIALDGAALEHFGGKDGLLAGLVDCTIHDSTIELAQQTEGVAESEERIRLICDGIESMARDTQSFATYFEIPPHALRDPELRGRVESLYEWYRELYRRVLQVGGIDSHASRGLAPLLTAVLDGLAIQYSLAPDEFDIAGACRELDLLLSLRSEAALQRT